MGLFALVKINRKKHKPNSQFVFFNCIINVAKISMDLCNVVLNLTANNWNIYATVHSHTSTTKIMLRYPNKSAFSCILQQ